ncbi:hypothetical protein [Agromyces albus]|uniref:Uncharacterized protein n=1 Tax=Agromyces albus TaxID=205332 RepID=A0A4Q2KU63_9MICO|nr:hypothetical protein [Agromyces albus]RXZ69068.1 hypothetical protein ESP51_12530 [Agromyces albus]
MFGEPRTGREIVLILAGLLLTLFGVLLILFPGRANEFDTFLRKRLSLTGAFVRVRYPDSLYRTVGIFACIFGLVFTTVAIIATVRGFL